MHPLHDYIAERLAERLKQRRVVVWYDEKADFAAFVAEVRGGVEVAPQPMPISVSGVEARLAEHIGSMFELRAAVEPLVSDDQPEVCVLYLPRVARDRDGSVLMELEKAGTTWEPQLNHLARNVLLAKYTQGVVDDILRADRVVSYEDLAHAVSGNSGAEPPSVLKSIFADASGQDGLLAAWLAGAERDGVIEKKDAVHELARLVEARLGLEVPDEAPLAKVRALTLRYVLAGEFRLDLSCEPPRSLDSVARPTGKDHETAVHDLARRLRSSFPDAYPALADRVEEELGLAAAEIPASALGSIDTFRFEERALLARAGDLIAGSRFDDALALVAERERSFWVDRDVSRKAHWEVARLMAELGSLATGVRAEVAKTAANAQAWLAAYVADDGWHRLDQAQRRLEAWVANLDDDAEERPLGVVRRAYEDACQAMAGGFTRALEKAGWAIAGMLHQTQVFSDVVTATPKPVAYFLVDAMRYEMGVELSERLPRTSEVSVRPAIAALPSITPIGMAALMPGAATSFTVVEEAGKLGARIEQSFLPDLVARRKHAAARVPKLVDLTLDELLSLQPSKLAKKVEDAQVVVVRSQEIDHAGEGTFSFQARQVMDTVIDNLARALRKLAAAGIEHAVVSADHGHLFFAADRDESMRTDAPIGNKVELHRRCWIGRGGNTPPGCVRVAASALGYASDLDFVFPIAGVFRAGGDLAFHHGGPSLQELVVPVVTVRTPNRSPAKRAASPMTLTGVPVAVTNRIFSVTVELGSRQMSLGATSMAIRPLLLSSGKQVGAVGMVLNAELDRGTGVVTLGPNKPATVGFLLSDDQVASVRIVVLDPATDAELYRSASDIPVRLTI